MHRWLRQKKFQILLVLGCLLVFEKGTAVTRFVSHSGSNTSPFISWETASTTVEAANAVAQPGDTIFVDSGIFQLSTTIKLPHKITLLGKGIDSTQIWGNDSGAAEMFRPADSTIIEGITFRGNGAYTCFSTYSETYPDLTFRHVAFSKFAGYSLIIDFSNTVLIHNCTFEKDPSALTLIEATARKQFTVENCVFSIPEGFARPLLFTGYNATLIFRDNIVSGAWEMVLGGGDGPYAFWDISRNLVFASPLADGLIVSGVDSINIVGNSFFTTFDHFVFPTEMVAVDCRDMKYCRILNNAFVGYRPRIRLTGPIGAPAAIKVMYNCLHSLEPFSDAEYINITDGVVRPDSMDFNLFRDPMFVDPATGDLHLQQGSPAIDAGAPWMLDLDGSRSDIGVYGGPMGEFYAYQDLPPLQPRDFTVSDSSGAISWTQNTESDISHYILFRSPDTPVSLDSAHVACYVDAGGRILARHSPPGYSNLLSDHFDLHAYSLGGHQWITIQNRDSDNSAEFAYALVAVDKSGLNSPAAIIDRLDFSNSPGYVPANDHAYPLNSHNYPNPFNAETAIVYNLPNIGAQPARIKLTIYNTLGQTVTNLIDENQLPGEHRVVWNGLDANGREMATGIYFYRLEVSGIEFVSKGKMVLMK